MKVCTQCNSVNIDEAQFCNKCGAPLPASQPVNNGYQQPAQPGGYAQYQAPKPQPQAAYQQPMPERPSTHLGLAITTTVLCCVPLGIPAIVYATKVNNMYNEGNYTGAQNASSKAKSFSIWGMVLGFIFQIILYAIYFFAIAAASY